MILNKRIGLDKMDSMLTVFLDVPLTDEAIKAEARITIRGADIARAVGMDCLNGTCQELHIDEAGGDTVLKEIRVRDYPLFIKLSKSNKDSFI